MPNSLYTGTASDWANMFKEYSTTEGGISLWEQALTSLQQTADIQAQAVQASADYDISQAYANYLQSQRQISQASNLGTGFKEQLESNLQSSYQSAFGQAETEEAQGLYDVAQQYSENVTETENQFAEVGSALSSIDEQKINYLQTYGQYIPGYKNIDWSGNLVEQGIYDLDANNNLVLTEKGKDLMNYTLLERITIPGEAPEDYSSISFEEYLKLNSEDDYNNYLKYYDIYRSGFDIEPGTIARTEDEKNWRTQAVDLLDYFDGSVPEFDSYEEQYNYLLNSGLGVKNGYEALTNLENTLETMIVRHKENRAAYVDDENVLKNQLTDLGFNEDSISFGADYNKNHDHKYYYTISVSGTGLNDMQKHILEQLGFTLQRDNSYKYEKQATTGAKDVNDFFAR